MTGISIVEIKRYENNFKQNGSRYFLLLPFTHPPPIFLCHNKPDEGDRIKYDCLLLCLADSSPTVLSKINVMAGFVRASNMYLTF